MGPESCKADGDGDRLVLLGGDDGVDHHLLDNACCGRPFCKIVPWGNRVHKDKILCHNNKTYQAPFVSLIVALDRRIGSITVRSIFWIPDSFNFT